MIWYILAAPASYVAIMVVFGLAWGRELARLRTEVARLRALLRLHAIDDPVGGEPQDALAQHERDDGKDDERYGHSR